MISRNNLLEMFNQEVIFRGFSRRDDNGNHIIINNELDYDRTTDWNGMHYVMPYVNKRCDIIRQNDDGSIRCEFDHCDMDGNITDDGLTSGLSFEFAEYSNGVIDYDPVFEIIGKQDNIIVNNIIQINNDIPIMYNQNNLNDNALN